MIGLEVHGSGADIGEIEPCIKDPARLEIRQPPRKRQKLVGIERPGKVREDRRKVFVCGQHGAGFGSVFGADAIFDAEHQSDLFERLADGRNPRGAFRVGLRETQVRFGHFVAGKDNRAGRKGKRR